MTECKDCEDKGEKCAEKWGNHQTKYILTGSTRMHLYQKYFIEEWFKMLWSASKSKDVLKSYAKTILNCYVYNELQFNNESLFQDVDTKVHKISHPRGSYCGFQQFLGRNKCTESACNDDIKHITEKKFEVVLNMNRVIYLTN